MDQGRLGIGRDQNPGGRVAGLCEDTFCNLVGDGSTQVQYSVPKELLIILLPLNKRHQVSGRSDVLLPLLILSRWVPGLSAEAVVHTYLLP